MIESSLLRRAAHLAAVLHICLSGASALAQSPVPDAVTDAKQHFEAGREAMKNGDLKRACAEFTVSLSIRKAVGPLVNLAGCEEQRGRVASALARYEELLTMVPASDERHTLAREKAAALRPRVPRLTVQLAAGVPAGARALLDDRELAKERLGAPMLLDPGSYTLSLAVPGSAERRMTLTLVEGGEQTVTLTPEPSLTPAPASTPGPVAAASTGAPPPPATGTAGGEVAAPVEHVMSTTRKVGIAALGAGGAGLVAGAVLGALSAGQRSNIVSNCQNTGSGYLCPETQRSALDAGFALAHGSTLAFAIGGAAAATGALLVVLGGRAPARAAVTVRPFGAGLSVEGRF